MDDLSINEQFVPLREEELEFLTDLAVNESQRWIEAVTRTKFRSPDFLESLEDGVLLCELVDRTRPRYVDLDDENSESTRLYGQYTLEAFRNAATDIGIDEEFVFTATHIHAPERYICSVDAEDAICEALIRVTVTIYLLGCRAKQTLAFTGPQLDLSAFTQLYQHYLHNLYGNQNTLCNQVDKPFEETVVATGTAYFAHEKQTVTDTGDELNSGSVTPRSESTEMPGQVSCEINDVDDPLSLGPKSSLGSDSYREGKRGYYADSIGSSCDSACSSSSPSMVDNSGRPQIMNGTYKDEFVKPKEIPPMLASYTNPTSTYVEVDKAKQKQKEDEAEWQMNFDSWKSKRKSCLPVSDRDSDEHDDTKESAGGNLKTFPAMIAERLQRQGGALASYLDDSLGDELPLPSVERENLSPVSSHPSSHGLDDSGKDSSSGISSPRSSRSLVSVSPPPSPAVKQLVSNLAAAGAMYQQNLHTKLKPETTATMTSRKVIRLKNMADKKNRSAGAFVASDSPEKSDAENHNPNIETTNKPFKEKLAMFRKAQEEDMPVKVDLEKCSYKEFAKPELSLKDKVSLIQQSMELANGSEKRVSPACVPKAKITPDSSAATTPSTESVSILSESRSGISRLLSKDLLSSSHMSVPALTRSVTHQVTSFEFDHAASETYLEQIDDIIGYNGRKNSSSVDPDDHEVDFDFPPPPLPTSPPPPVFGADMEDGSERDNEPLFPSPPPPITDYLQQDNEATAAASSESSSSSLPSLDQDPPFRRADSTKRIKTELLKRRSDFFGIASEPVEYESRINVQKKRPSSLHELAVLKADDSLNSSKAVSFETNVLFDQAEANHCDIGKKDPMDGANSKEQSQQKDLPVPSVEKVVSMIVEEYKKEIESEDNHRSSKKEQVGILKNRNKTEEKSRDSCGDKPDLLMSAAEEFPPREVVVPDKKVVILDKIEKFTEETRITGSFESTSREEMRSLDYLTVSNRLPTSMEPPHRNRQAEQSSRQHPLQHYRDYSDGGYSSGRSDQGNTGKFLGGMPSHGSVERPLHGIYSNDPQPPRPPFPTEFRPEPLIRPSEENRQPYNSQFHVAAAPPLAPSRSQRKPDMNRKLASAADAQRHWLVQEAEMRRIAEMDERVRYPVTPAHSLQTNPVAVPSRVHNSRPAVPKSDTVENGFPIRENPTHDVYQRRVVELGAKHNGPIVHQLPTRTATMVPVVMEQPRNPMPRSHSATLSAGIMNPVPSRHGEVSRMSNEHYVPNGLIPSHPQAQQQYPYQFHPPSSMGSQTSLISQPKSFSSYQPVSNLGSPMNSTAGPGGVSSKRRCAHCGEALGRGAAMIVENLHLYYHVTCFKCFVCGQTLGNGKEGADVRVRNAKLHCALCYSDEEGLQLSQL